MCSACIDDAEMLEKIKGWVDGCCFDDSREMKQLVRFLKETLEKHWEERG